jgi:hypothetical protein
MDESRKYAYRQLLYWALLEIRPIAWPSPKWSQRLNPVHWFERFRHMRAVGVVADWLHNLAIYSAGDFKGFDEEWFWQEHEWIKARIRHSWFNYRALFERSLRERSSAECAPASTITG